MAEKFQANCLPLLIGSIPMGDHSEASKLVLNYTPEIPLWVQLPVYKEEGMVFQFSSGMPSLAIEDDTPFIDAGHENFNDDLVKFYEEYMAVTDGQTDISNSRFALDTDTARGFFVLKDKLGSLSEHPVAIKGQVTGPITFTTDMKDENGRAIFYDEQLRDAAVKLLAMKAGWQITHLSKFSEPVIIFIDEPALAGFGSSEFISISSAEVAACLNEVIEEVHKHGGLAGIHVCANTDWSLVLETSVDIVNFDAYSYFDKFMLYPDHIKKYIESGRMIAWGIVPTLKPEDIEKETTDSLHARWEENAKKVEALGIDRSVLLKQSFITPSCGTGSLSLDHATKVLRLTKEVSDRLREEVMRR